MIRIRELLVFVPVFVFTITTWSQDIGWYHFEEFDLAHKAGVPGVYSMFQDTTGVIWFGSTNGIYRYDGSRVYEFGAEQKKLLGKTNYSFLQAKNGDVLIGSDYGICRYSIISNSVKLIVHLNRVFNDRSRYYPVCFGDNGSLWFVASGKGVGVYSGEGITWIENPPGIPDELVSKISAAFYYRKTGEIFLSNYLNAQTVIFNIRTRTFKIDSLHNTFSFVQADSCLFRVHSENILSVNLISGEKNTFIPAKDRVLTENTLYSKSLIIDDEWLWVSLRDGILPFNYRKGVFGRPFGYNGDTKSGMLRHISEVFKDKEGNIWVCTETNGIKILNRNHLHKFQFLFDVNISNNIIMDIESINDSLMLVCPLLETPRIVNIFTNSHHILLPEGTIGKSSFDAVRVNETTLLLTKQNGETYTFNTNSLRLEKLTTPIPSILKIIVTSQPNILLFYTGTNLMRCKYDKGTNKS